MLTRNKESLPPKHRIQVTLTKEEESRVSKHLDTMPHVLDNYNNQPIIVTRSKRDHTTLLFICDGMVAGTIKENKTTINAGYWRKRQQEKHNKRRQTTKETEQNKSPPKQTKIPKKERYKKLYEYDRIVTMPIGIQRTETLYNPPKRLLTPIGLVMGNSRTEMTPIGIVMDKICNKKPCPKNTSLHTQNVQKDKHPSHKQRHGLKRPSIKNKHQDKTGKIKIPSNVAKISSKNGVFLVEMKDGKIIKGSKKSIYTLFDL